MFFFFLFGYFIQFYTFYNPFEKRVGLLGTYHYYLSMVRTECLIKLRKIFCSLRLLTDGTDQYASGSRNTGKFLFLLKMSEELAKICIVVLGDIGRSPRMQYHSKSLAEHGHKVDIVCYQETKPINSLISQPHVTFHYLLPYKNIPLSRIFNYIFKTLWQLVTLMFVLFIIRKPNVLLVQNPPAVPALVVCLFYCKVMRVKYIVDWHNYAFSIMALSTNKNHMLVKITKKIEMFAGKRAACNFCVTKEMQRDLLNNWDIR